MIRSDAPVLQGAKAGCTTASTTEPLTKRDTGCGEVGLCVPQDLPVQPVTVTTSVQNGASCRVRCQDLGCTKSGEGGVIRAPYDKDDHRSASLLCFCSFHSPFTFENVS